MKDILDKLETILQRRLNNAFIVEQDEAKTDLYAELIGILRELRSGN